MSLRLKVLDAAATSLVRLIRESPKWLSVMCIPWLLGSALYAYAAYAIPRTFQIGGVPSWVTAAIFLPFSAIVATAVLKNIIHRRPCGIRSVELSADTVRVGAVLLVMALADLLIGFARDQAISAYANYQVDNSIAFSLEESKRVGAALTGLVWLFTCLATMLIYPMAPIVIERRRFDFGLWLGLMKAHWWHFLLLTALLSAAYKGFEELYGSALRWLVDLPIPDRIGQMQEILAQQFLQLLLYIPVDFVVEILPPLAAGIVYAALMSRHALDRQREQD